LPPQRRFVGILDWLKHKKPATLGLIGMVAGLVAIRHRLRQPNGLYLDGYRRGRCPWFAVTYFLMSVTYVTPSAFSVAVSGAITGIFASKRSIPPVRMACSAIYAIWIQTRPCYCGGIFFVAGIILLKVMDIMKLRVEHERVAMDLTQHRALAD
jgi:ammonia channel protein AmtB